MDACLEALAPDSPRYKTLAAARRFKASWVELGQHLTLAREQAAYKGWGFASFEAYCRRELRIKQDTANKLTRSFAFLRDHEPTMLEAGEKRELPPLDVVDLLSQARERTQLSDDKLCALQEEAFAADAKPTRQGLMKKLREADPQAFRATPKVANDTPPEGLGHNELRKALLLAERLESVLTAQGDGVSQQTVGHAHSVVTELRARFAQSRQQGAA